MEVLHALWAAGGRMAALFVLSVVGGLAAGLSCLWLCRAGAVGRLAGCATAWVVGGLLGGPLPALVAAGAVVAAKQLPQPRLPLALERLLERKPGEGIAIGWEVERGREVRIPLRHTVVVGASGSGKTVTLSTILREAAPSHGLVVIDGKGDPDLEEAVVWAARASGRERRIWSPHGSLRYNPFAHGSETEIVDKALAAESFGDSYYLRLGQRFLGFAVRALRAAGREVTVADLSHYADPQQLAELAGAIEGRHPGAWIEIATALPKLSAQERQGIAGTQHRLAAIAESDVGPLIAGGPGQLDLLAAVVKGEAVYFNLNSDARPQLSRMVGAAVLIDLLTVAAALQRAGRAAPTVVVVDDLQGFASEPAARALASLFARARSAGFCLLVGTQSLADLELPGGRGFDQLLDNRYALLVHRLPGYRSAQAASRELGEADQVELHEQLREGLLGWRSAGRASRSCRPRPWVTPAELAALAVGHAYLKRGGEPPLAVQVRRR